jgi:dTDP-L-rhamnose 4-epimerase
LAVAAVLAAPLVAAAHGARVVLEPRRGFGAACLAGLLAASDDLVCFLDADGSLDPAELPALVEPVAARRADLVLGSRRPAGRGAWPAHARFANRVLVHRLAARTGLRLRVLGPLRVARRGALVDLGLGDRRFGWPLVMVVGAHAAGWVLDEVAVSYHARRGGRSKVTGTALGSVRTVRDMSEVLRSCT